MLPHALSGVTCGSALATYTVAEREAPLPHSCLASGVSGQTPMIGRTSGRLPKRTRKDSGQGRGSPLTRVFAFLETTTDRLFPPGHIINMDSLQRRARSQSHSVSHEMLGKNILDT